MVPVSNATYYKIRLGGAGGSVPAGEFTITCEEQDCNGNNIPDQVDIENCPSDEPWCRDCNFNGVLDLCDVIFNPEEWEDCQDNFIPDRCEISGATCGEGYYCTVGCDPDLNGNCVPDECDVDCQPNGVSDNCDLDCSANEGACNVPGCGQSADCQPNGIPDECEVPPIDPGAPDCNSNGIPDDCEVDCQPNGLPDECDISGGTSQDVNNNDIPDECDECTIDADCDDGFYCNGPEWCDVDQCQGGLLPDCVDFVVVDPSDPVRGYDATVENRFDVWVTATSFATFDAVDLLMGSETDMELSFVYAQSFLDTCTLPPPTPIEWDVYAIVGGGDVFAGGFNADGDWSAPLLVGTLTVDVSGLSGPAIIQVDAAWERNIVGSGLSSVWFGGVSEDLFGSVLVPDCNGNGVYDVEDIAVGTSEDCTGNGIPDECEPDCNENSIADSCDIAGGTSQDCQLDGIPDDCQVPPIDPDEPDCNGNGIPDECDPDCQPNGVADSCDIADGTSQDCNSNGIPDECPGCEADCECDNRLFCDGGETCESGICTDQADPCSGLVCDEENDLCPSPPELPADAKHRAIKHRYLSVNPSTNAPSNLSLKVEVAEMRRCVVDPRRACLVDQDCDPVCANDLDKYCTSSEQCGGADCIETGPCRDMAPDYDPPLSWIVQHPVQEPEGSGCKKPGCPPYDPGEDNCCTYEDWVARLAGTVYSEDWSAYTVLHIGDCGIVPCVTYHVYACDPLNLDICSEPLEIGTQRFPALFPFKLYGDVTGGTVLPGPEVLSPDGYVNVADLQVAVFTILNYGSANKPQAHPTWADLHGLGTGAPPNYILDVADLTAVYVFGLTQGLPWVNTQGGLDPQDCP
jgi:hypothetical protein